jgi:hypothetical protein
MVHGRAAIKAMWESMAEQVGDPKLTTLDVKPLGPSAAREIGTFVQALFATGRVSQIINAAPDRCQYRGSSKCSEL